MAITSANQLELLQTAEAVAARMQRGGRLFYLGAGTSAEFEEERRLRRRMAELEEALGVEDAVDEELQLGAEVDVVEKIMELTDGRGADVVLDNMGAKYLGRNVDALATAAARAQRSAVA